MSSSNSAFSQAASSAAKLPPELESSLFRACTLEERMDLLGSSFDPADTSAGGTRWTEKLRDAGVLDEVCAEYGVTEDSLAALLGADGPQLQAAAGSTPMWIDTARRGWPLAPADEEPYRALVADHRHEAADFLVAFLPVIVPIARAFRRRLSDLEARDSHDLIDTELLYEPVVDGFLTRPARMIGRTMMLELHVARREGRLSGDTSEARYQDYLRELETREARRRLYDEYPCLVRAVARALRQSADACIELLERLVDDVPSWKPFTGSDPTGRVKNVDLGLGDRHAEGRSVALITFASGDRLVYKPKSLAVDEAFYDWLDRLWDDAQSARDGTVDSPFEKRPRVADRGKYGWAEYVRPQPCTSEADVERFYYRHGAYLAVLYALQSTDMHYENVLAGGDAPVFVDLETLLHPFLQDTSDWSPGWYAEDVAQHTVLELGLLPRSRSPEGVGRAGPDLAGMVHRSAQEATTEVVAAADAGTDRMRLARQTETVDSSDNRPMLDGEVAYAQDYADAVVDGFETAYDAIRDGRDRMEAALERFRTVETRVVVRSTAQYQRLHRESFHPDYLRHGSARDVLFAGLWRDADRHPHLRELVGSEVRALHDGDVPVFRTSPGSQDVWDGRGQRRKGLLPASGIERGQQRLRALSEQDRERQAWAIRACLARRLSRRASGTDKVRADRAGPAPDLVEAATSIGDRLLRLCVHASRDDTWLALHDQDTHWSVGPLNADVYDGLSGMALFLGYLARVTGQDRFAEAAAAVRPTIERFVRHADPVLVPPGAYAGAGGILYADDHLRSLGGKGLLAEEARTAALDRLEGGFDAEAGVDVIDGVAGGVGALCAMYEHSPSERLRRLIEQGADVLVARSEPQAAGAAWPVEDEKPALAGFAHGAAGVAWALLRAYRVTETDAYRAAAEEGLAFERHVFDEKRQNWPDLRPSPDYDPATGEGEPRFMVAWCHGATGIGLARIDTLDVHDDAATRDEIRAAVDTTRDRGVGHTHCLCHGDFGSVDLLVEANALRPDDERLAAARQLASRAVTGARSDGWQCGTVLDIETPGLMTGLAGIGYGLLRAARPDAVPSVLTLSPPTTGESAGAP